MKFQFKIQPFQTEAADAIVKVFAGQNKRAETQYRRDIGKKERDLFELGDDYEVGYRNADINVNHKNQLPPFDCNHIGTWN